MFALLSRSLNREGKDSRRTRSSSNKSPSTRRISFSKLHLKPGLKLEPPSVKPPSTKPPETVDPPQENGSFELKKRRVHVPVTIFDKPLVSELEFIVDPRYQSLKMLGCGSFGVVVSAIDKTTGDNVAIKRIDGAFSSLRMARYVLRELRLLHHLRHPNIVSLLDVDMPNKMRYWDEVYIVTPLLKMDLTTAFRKGLVDNKRIQKRIAYQLMLGLEHMHSLGLMHRDVKPRNVLLDENLNAQLCDLGHSRFHSKANRELDIDLHDSLFDEPDLSGVITTMIQSAPELTLGAEYDAAVDIWAAGCVIAQIVRRDHETLFDNTGKNSHLTEIFQVVGYPSEKEVAGYADYGKRFVKRSQKANRKGASKTFGEAVGIGVDKQAVNLLERMLCFSTSDRLTASEALEHPWFDEVREPAAVNREAYDFAKSEPNRKATKVQLKQLAWQEVSSFHPEVLTSLNRKHA